jgi:hypothetical protein
VLLVLVSLLLGAFLTACTLRWLTFDTDFDCVPQALQEKAKFHGQRKGRQGKRLITEEEKDAVGGGDEEGEEEEEDSEEEEGSSVTAVGHC